MGLKKNILLFLSLERYAFLILGLQIFCGFLEILNIKYVPSPYFYFYLVPHMAAGAYFLGLMLWLFSQWPRKKRFHNMVIRHYSYMKANNRHIGKARLSAMSTACEKITRNEIYRILES